MFAPIATEVVGLTNYWPIAVRAIARGKCLQWGLAILLVSACEPTPKDPQGDARISESEKVGSRLTDAEIAASKRPSAEVMALGKDVFLRPGGCVSCHGANGEGSFAIPPLANELQYVPGDPERLVKLVYHGVEGYIRVNSIGYDSYMPAQGSLLTDKELAAVLTYIRNDLGNRAAPISEDFVSQIVAKYGEREEPWHTDILLDRNAVRPAFEFTADTLLRATQNEAAIYRHFMEQSSPRTIAVALPEQVNYVFDNSKFQISALWRGDFVNAGEHWSKRSRGRAPMAGEDILLLSAAIQPFVELAPPSEKIPAPADRAAGYDFGGYQIDDKRRPIFHYAWNGLEVDDFTEAVLSDVSDSVAVNRRLNVRSNTAKSGIYFVAAQGNSIVDLGDSKFRIDGCFDVTLSSSNDRVTTRETEHGHVLLVPLEFTRNGDGYSAQIEFQINW